VLILKQDSALDAAFATFFAAAGAAAKLEALEALSVELRGMARAELDRLRASIHAKDSTAAESEEEEDELTEVGQSSNLKLLKNNKQRGE